MKQAYEIDTMSIFDLDEDFGRNANLSDSSSERIDNKKRVMTECYNDIARRLNMNITDVKQVIDAFVAYCYQGLLRRLRITLFDLADIIPTPEYCACYITPMFLCKVIAEENGWTYVTTAHIISEYFALLREDIEKGIPVTIRGLCTLTPMKNERDETILHASISRSISASLLSIGIKIRIHTNKVLKSQLKRCTMLKEV